METRITVQQEEANWLIEELTQAGLTVMDTGERVTTDEGIDAEAVLHVASFQHEEQEASKQSRLLRP